MASKDRQHTVALGTPIVVPKTSDQASVLVLLYPPGPQIGRRYELASGEYVVGRLAENPIPVDADSVSRRHAKLHLRADGWVVEDLGSTNGTFVNDVKIAAPTAIHDGDQLRFGSAIFKFLSGANIEAEYHEEIYRMSIVDGLTTIHNKRYFMDFMEREIAGAARYHLPLSLVMFDVDHFKRVNDTHGHLAGDTVLKEIARRIKARTRREDLFARYGGEEFACVLTKTPREGALAFAEAIRQMVAAAPVRWETTDIPVTVSLGCATFHADKPAPVAQLIKLADERLYEAKGAGRNRVVG